MFQDIIQKRVERSLFEVLRKIIVAQGYLPDITNNVLFPLDVDNNFTQAAQDSWDAAIAAIVVNKGWSLEIFGASSAFAKGLKRTPRVVIIPKRIMPGDIGMPPGFVYNINDAQTLYNKTLYPDESANMHFDIHLISSSQEQSRFLNMLLSTVIGQKRYITFEDNNSERFFIKHYNYYDVSDSGDGIEENVYSYEVQDLYLFQDTELSIKPIIEINTNIIVGYDSFSNPINLKVT